MYLLTCRQFLAKSSCLPAREQCFSQLNSSIQEDWHGSSLAAQLPLCLAGLTVLASDYHGAETAFTFPCPICLCIGSGYNATVPQLSPSVGGLKRCYLSLGIGLDQCKPVRRQGIYQSFFSSHQLVGKFSLFICPIPLLPGRCCELQPYDKDLVVLIVFTQLKEALSLLLPAQTTAFQKKKYLPVSLLSPVLSCAVLCRALGGNRHSRFLCTSPCMLWLTRSPLSFPIRDARSLNNKTNS